MEKTASRELLTGLFEEYAAWYSTLAEEYGSLPRSVSGVDKDGLQFIFLLDTLDMHHMARNKFVRFVLDELKSVAYAYGSLELRGDSDEGQIEEALDVVAADSGYCISGSWQVVRGEEGKVTGLVHLGSREGTDIMKHSGSWFLAGSIRFSEAEKRKYGSLWEDARPGIVFKQRNDAD